MFSGQAPGRSYATGKAGCGASRDHAGLVATVYVTGHRNPDTDSIASAIGYAELKGRLDSRNDYVPVRLGALNDQTRWVLERAGAPEPRLLPPRDAARARRDAQPLPARQPRRAGAPGRPDHGPRRRRPRPDRRRRRRAGRGDDRARARPPLRARVARGVAARRADRGRRDRRRAGGRAAGGRGGDRRSPAASGCWRWRAPRSRSASGPATSSSWATGPRRSGSRSRSASGCSSSATARGRPTRCSRSRASAGSR